MRRRVLGAALAACVLCAVPGVARGQQRVTRVTLRIRPPMGDTLRMAMQQQFDMSSEDSAGVPQRSMAGTLLIWTHALVLRRVGTATDLASTADSVVVQPPSAAAWPPLRDAKRELTGRTVHLRVSAAGELTVERRGATSALDGPVMPAVLPAGPVQVGDTWTRELRIPLSTTRDAVGLVRTTFRLDSLGAGGAVAFISMRGDVSHDHATDHHGMTGQVTGSVTGTLQVDRRLAWITDSRMTVSLLSIAGPTGQPLTRMRIHVTQVIRALPGS